MVSPPFKVLPLLLILAVAVTASRETLEKVDPAYLLGTSESANLVGADAVQNVAPSCDAYIGTTIKNKKIVGCTTKCTDKAIPLQQFASSLGVDYNIIQAMNPQYAGEKLIMNAGECINVPTF